MRLTVVPTGILLALTMLGGCAAAGTQSATRPIARLDTGPGVILASAAPGATTAPQPLPQGPAVWGILVDGTGQPLPGATVKAFDALIGNHAAGLVSNAAGNLASRTRRVAANEGLTGVDGSFLLTLPATGTYNLEGDKGGALKVFVRAIPVEQAAIKQIGSQTMTPPGILSGTVRDSKGTSDLTGAQVFIPGSPYSAFVTASGAYTLGGVAAGSHDLRAIHPTLGDARSEGAVLVSSGKTTQAPELILATDAVSVDRLRDAGTGATASVSAPGALLVLEGTGFGQTRGRAFTLEIGGVQVTAATRSSDTRIEARVPSGAQNGDLVLRVDATTAKALPLRIIKSLGWRRNTWRLGLGDTLDPWALADVRDTSGQWVDIANTGAGPLRLSNVPEAPLARSGSNDSPRLEASATGSTTLTLQAGTLPTSSLALTVGAAGTGDQLALLPPRAGATPAPTTIIRDGEVTVGPESGEVLIRNPLNQWAIYELTEAPGVLATPAPDTEGFYQAWPTGALMVRSGSNLLVLGGRKGHLVPPRQELALRLNVRPGTGQSPLPARTVRWNLTEAFSIDETATATSSERVVTLAASASSGITLPLPERFRRKVVRIRAAGDWGVHGGDSRGPDGQGAPGICTTPCDGLIPESALIRVEAGTRLESDYGTANPTSFVGSDAILLVDSGEALVLRMQDWHFVDNRGSLEVWWDVLWQEP